MSQEIYMCPICDNVAEKTNHEHTFRVKCPLCGDFNIGDSFFIPTFTEEEKLKLRYLYRNLDREDEKRVTEWITNANKEDFLSKIDNPPSSLLGKIDLVLEHINIKTKYFEQEIRIYWNEYPLFFCIDDQELKNILDYLNREELIVLTTTVDNMNPSNSLATSKIMSDVLAGACSMFITPKGIKQIKESDKNPKSKQCFVAMWFNEDETIGPNVEKAYIEAIKPAIEYEDTYEAYKVDTDKDNIDWIPDRIIKKIRQSKFMIADLTGYRGGVYYEAGFAEGLGLKVIYTCNKEWFDGWTKKCECTNCKQINDCKKENVHFDLKQKSFLFWLTNPNHPEYEKYNLEKFKKQLIERIGANIY